jgi:hypothetical protein
MSFDQVVQNIRRVDEIWISIAAYSSSSLPIQRYGPISVREIRYKWSRSPSDWFTVNHKSTIRIDNQFNLFYKIAYMWVHLIKIYKMPENILI